MVVNEQIVFVESSDRFIFLQHDKENKLIGINYMQGYNINLFKQKYSKNEVNLLNFINRLIKSCSIKPKPDFKTNFKEYIKWIDDLIWLHVDVFNRCDIYSID